MVFTSVLSRSSELSVGSFFRAVEVGFLSGNMCFGGVSALGPSVSIVLFLFRRALLARNLTASLSSLGEADRNRLLLARYFLARAPAR